METERVRKGRRWQRKKHLVESLMVQLWEHIADSGSEASQNVAGAGKGKKGGAG